MNNEEVIKTIKIAKAEVEWNYPMEYQEAFDIAIDCIEKQIPKKPIDRRRENYPSGMFKWFHCSCCDAELRTGREAYCEWCGQKFDLSEVQDEIN